MQAFMAGKIKVQGDMTKLMAMQQQTPDANAQAMADALKEITA
jgi:putative sterol carrier protein